MGKLPRGNRSPCCRQRDGRFQVAPVPWESIYASSHETQFGQEATLAQVACRPSGCRLRSVTGRRRGNDANLVIGQADQPPLFALTP